MTQTIRFGHSPDPDDAFMFYAIAKNKIDLKGFSVEHVVEDIESLNHRALKAELEVTAISVHCYAYVHQKYTVMRSGASIGEKYGPIVVARTMTPSPLSSPPSRGRGLGEGDGTWLKGKKIAVPGLLTTAVLALKIYEPDFSHIVVPFDQILDYVKEGKADAGLIIHEGQLTYQRYGLEKVVDLGEWWWQETQLPLPLGIDVIRKDLGKKTMESFSGVFKDSIVCALENREEALEYALPYGRGLEMKEADRFVGMYVNDDTVDLGKTGEESICELLKRGYEKKLLKDKVVPEFI